MLYRITRLRINCMCVLLTSFIVKITVVATRCHRYIRHVQSRLELMTNIQGVICRFYHAHPPRYTILVNSTSHDFATNFNHKVFHSSSTQVSCHHISTISLGNRRTVEHHSGITFPDSAINQRNLIITHESFDAIHLISRRHFPVLETKSPCIYQRGYCNVKGTIGFL